MNGLSTPPTPPSLKNLLYDIVNIINVPEKISYNKDTK